MFFLWQSNHTLHTVKYDCHFAGEGSVKTRCHACVPQIVLRNDYVASTVTTTRNIFRYSHIQKKNRQKEEKFPSFKPK